MADDLADELQSKSNGSSSRSGSETVSSELSISSGSADPPESGEFFSESGKMGIIRPSDLRFVRKLGSGDIGSVYLAELKGSSMRSPPSATAAVPCMVAVKVMNKKEMEGRKKYGNWITEREILEMLDHPFLPRLYGSIESDRWSCLITEFCPGGDLHVLRQRQPGRRFDEAAVRFYASEVLVALEYLHVMGIVYRDLKPENVLVRSDGHIILTDFDLSLRCFVSTAKIVSNRDPHPVVTTHVGDKDGHHSACILPSCIVPTVSCFRPKLGRRRKAHRAEPTLEFIAEPVGVQCMSFVGTHEYLAPEIALGLPHGNAVDWWTLGVFVYELLYGVTPFRGGDDEQTLANIVARALEFPKEPPVSQPTKDLIASLLVKQPTQRLGAATGAAAVRRYPFFGGVNWALLRCAKPPYVPPLFTAADQYVPPPWSSTDF